MLVTVKRVGWNPLTRQHFIKAKKTTAWAVTDMKISNIRQNDRTRNILFEKIIPFFIRNIGK
jgi:hypothetical protein